jgi:FkbM family methyltransferase
MFLDRMAAPGKGLLFEPSPLAVARLLDNLKNELNNNLVEIVPAAVCEQTGTMDFYMEEAAGETSSLIPSHSNDLAQKICVTTTTIDAEVAKHDFKFIDFLKIDAEGYDLQVLRGSRNCLKDKVVGVIQFEYNKPWADSSSTIVNAIGYLKSYGYSVYLLKRKGLYTFDYEQYGEYFQYSNFVAIAPGYLEVAPLSL